jgi:hypothetical protein
MQDAQTFRCNSAQHALSNVEGSTSKKIFFKFDPLSDLRVLRASLENLAGGGAYAASAIGESSTSCPSSRSLRTW